MKTHETPSFPDEDSNTGLEKAEKNLLPHSKYYTCISMERHKRTTCCAFESGIINKAAKLPTILLVRLCSTLHKKTESFIIWIIYNMDEFQLMWISIPIIEKSITLYPE